MLWCLLPLLVLPAAAALPEDALQILRPSTPSLRHGQTATLLPDGQWLLLGGEDKHQHQQPVSSGEIVGATVAGSLRAVTMIAARAGHTATMLPNGEVLVIGGIGDKGRIVEFAETILWQSGISARAALPGLLPRAYHSATILTDGRLLVVGGVGANGAVLDDVEVFNPLDTSVERFNGRLDVARFGHLATLLPASPVAVTQGVNAAQERVSAIELLLARDAALARMGSDVATLLPKIGDEFALPVVAGSIPANDAADVPVSIRIAVRLSKLLNVASLDADVVTLFGPNGVTPIRVVPAEGGLLLFISPTRELLPDSPYSLFLKGATDSTGLPLALTHISFRTAKLGGVAGAFGSATTPSATPMGTVIARGSLDSEGRVNAAPSTVLPGQTVAPVRPVEPSTARIEVKRTGTSADVDEEWIPDAQHYDTGNWRTDRLRPDNTDPRKRIGRKSASSVTALAGLVLRLNDLPLAGVTLRVGERTTQTGPDGTFLLEGVAAGWHTMAIDATTAGPDYGFFETLVHATQGETSVVPFAMWMPKLDRTHQVTIPSPTLTEVVLTTPRMPGFAVVIPKGAVVRDRAGKIVTTLGITPIPIDRTPFPLPIIFEFNTYYTIQPAGSSIESLDGKPIQARVIYPNYAKVEAGRDLLFWNYDAVERGWHVYGEGKVAPDAKSIVPGAEVGIYQFSGFMVSVPGTPPPTPCPCPAPDGGPPTPGSPFDGDPVNLATGAFMHVHTDLEVNDVVPLKLRRIYSSRDDGGGVRPFGVNMMAGIDYWLYNPFPNGRYGAVNKLTLTPPDGSSIDMLCVRGCTTADTGEFEVQTPGYYYKGLLKYADPDWTLTTKDGAKFVFYGSGGRIKYWTDRNGNKTTFVREPQDTGQLKLVISPNGRSIELAYNNGRIAAARDHTGRTWTYTYTGNQMVSATNPMGGVWQYGYGGPNGEMTTVRDPRGNIVVTNEYSYSTVSKQTYADGSTTSFAWSFGPPNWQYPTAVDVTDRRGTVRRVLFANYYITSDTFAFGLPESQSTSFLRQAGTNLLLSKTDPLGRITNYTYDANGNLLSETALFGTANATTTTFTYEPVFNQIATSTNALGFTTSFSYDLLGNLNRIVDPLGHSTDFTNSNQGQLLSMSNGLGHTSTYTYQAGVMSSIADPLNRLTIMNLDSLGRTVSVRDPLGNLTKTDYDALNRVTSTTDGNGNTVRYEYDGNGNLTAHLDQSNNRTEYTYDAMNRLATRKDALLRTENYAYEADSKLQRFTDRKSQVSSFTYDALGRRTRSGFGATVSAPTSYSSTISYTFDAGNRLTQANDSESGSIDRSYDGLDRLTSETTPLTASSYTYDAAGRRLTRAVPGQPLMTYGWDNANRLLSLTQGSQVVTFTYDNANRRNRVTLPNGIDINYGYDNASQLTSITYTKAAATLGDLTYTFDNAGRRTSLGGTYARTDLPTAIASTSHNASNQLTQWGAPALTYDFNGNLTNDGTYAYTWNSRNQLIQVQQGATPIASYQYDAYGRRKQNVVNGVTTQFVHDGSNFVQERDGGGVVTANLLTGMGLDEPYARSKGADTSSFLMDHLGSIIAEADAAGAVQTSYSYQPYGKATQTGVVSDNSQRYTGRDQDLTDVYYYRARYYSPLFSRFFGEDPTGFEDNPNLYAYVDGDPINFADPAGLARTPGGFATCVMGCNDQRNRRMRICNWCGGHWVGTLCRAWATAGHAICVAQCQAKYFPPTPSQSPPSPPAP